MNTTTAEFLRLTTAISSWRIDLLDKFITADPDMLKLKSDLGMVSEFRQVNTILITGPSGHGKELLASAARANLYDPFIPINCATLPPTLISSILFGHKKGAFTGAAEDKDGVFVSAGNGTVFLDEIGDMPAEQQPHLLRLIEQREVLPVGGTRTVQIKCRIILATHTVSSIRPDLLGRLMSIWFRIKPLTERPDDIELIAATLGLEKSDFPANLNEQLNLYGVRFLQSLATRKQYGL